MSILKHILFIWKSCSAKVNLLQFGEHYLDSNASDVPWGKFPEVLKSAELARIPPVPQGSID